jgi:uracil-DNA glycosylase
MIYIVGDKPSPRMKPDAAPFRGAYCEARLQEWLKALGIETHIICNRTDNTFTALKTLLLAYTMYEQRHNIRVIALGNEASKALGDIPHFKLPHPSGRNRQLNDKEFIAEKLKQCQTWLKEKQ